MTDEKEGGHGERSGAVGVLEMALWDALAKAESLPLWVLLERTLGHPNDGGPVAGSCAVYASGGHYGSGDLTKEVGDTVQAGYGWFKMKVGGTDVATDARRVNQALEALDQSSEKLAIDMNGVVTRDHDLQRLQVIDGLGLRWIEEPVMPLYYAGLAEVAGKIFTPIATGENIFSQSDVANLLRYGGLRTGKDILQMDMALAYGLTEYMRMIDLAVEVGWSRRDFMPHAGHQMALHTVAGLGLGAHEVAATGDGPFYGIDGTSEISNGTVWIGDAYGLGLEAKPSLYRYFDGLI
ncbi:MAG: enolase C-terminal domain-like protein [Pseudomonadota bacterium]|nr:enolase C-terminal domain-like protein [Pseudomonadota bacterium]